MNVKVFISLFVVIMLAFFVNTCKLEEIPPLQPPLACFTYQINVNLCQDSCEVQFNNCSENSDSYLWILDDTVTSTEINPIYKYAENKEYIVQLIAYQGSYSDTITDTVLLSDNPDPVACFTHEVIENQCYFTCKVQFTNCSQNAESYDWDFGDGTGTSTEENPVYEYSEGGTYNVRLIVEQGDKSDSTVHEIILQIEPAKFEKYLGGPDDDIGFSVKQLNDGGYVIVGKTQNYDADGTDVYLTRTDAGGNELPGFPKIFGDNEDDVGYSVQLTNDGGFAIVGNKGQRIYLIKTDANGDPTSGSGFITELLDLGNGEGRSIQQIDGGFVIVGTHENDNNNIILAKRNEFGEALYSNSIGGNNAEEGYSVQQTFDDGFIIVGYTESFGAGGKDVYLIKTNANCDTLLWTKTFGGSDDDIGYSVQQTADSGFIIVGATKSYGNDEADVYLIKTDSIGNEIFHKTFGENNISDVGYSVKQTSDGGYVITGYSYSFNVLNTSQVFLIRTDTDGTILSGFPCTFGGADVEVGYSVQQTIDDGFIIVGESKSQGQGEADVYLIKTDSDGNADK